MTNPKKKLAWKILACAGLLVIETPLLIWMLTGTHAKLGLLAVLPLVLLTFAVMMILSVRLGRINRAELPEKTPETPAEKARNRRGIALMIAAWVLAEGGQIIGILIGKKNAHPAWAGAVSWAWLGLILLLGACNVLLARRSYQRMNNMKVAESTAFLQAHRERAEQAAAELLRSLIRQRRLANGYALFLGVTAFAWSVLTGWSFWDDASVLRVFFSGFVLLAAMEQIPFSMARTMHQENPDVLPEQDFPELYAMARQAAAEMGVKAPIELLSNPGDDVGVGMVGNTFFVTIGVITLNVMSKEEFYTVFLHEFSHVNADNAVRMRLLAYRDFLSNGRTPTVLHTFIDVMYLALDQKYLTDQFLFEFCSSLAEETRADRAMAKHPTAGAAALLKLHYLHLYRWEAAVREDGALYDGETPADQILPDVLEQFERQMPDRAADWNSLIQKEIQSRSATHPTTWTRIRALGCETFPDPGERPAGTYRDECCRALERQDSHVLEHYVKNFEKDRKTYWLEPLELVEKWQAAGCPVAAEEYGDVLTALKQLLRYSEMEALCDRAIAELPPYAASQAYMVRGIQKTRRYDVTALDDLYMAIGQSANFIREGLDAIGEFCCMMGLQEELDTYRERALTFAQKRRDEDDQIDRLTRKDQIGPEKLPEGMLEGLLDYIAGISEDRIGQIYLVRKTVSETFFASAVVVRFLPDTAPEVQDRILHKIFRYLDTTTDWQFSLFDYTEVPKGLLESVPGSCVFQREE